MTEYLFTCTTLRLEGTTAFWCLKRQLPNRFFHQIKRLHLHYAYPQASSQWTFEGGFPPSNKNCWYQTCIEIAKMQSLRHLSVSICIVAPHINSDYEEMLLSPLKGSGEKMNVEVVVSWRRDSYEPVETKWPFVLRRRVLGPADNLWRCNEDCLKN